MIRNIFTRAQTAVCFSLYGIVMLNSPAAAQNAVGDSDNVSQSEQPSPPSKAMEAMPKNDRAGWIKSNDYPAWAIRSNTDGVVQFKLAVGPDGNVTDCAITKSSKVVDLDRLTCSKLTERAKFDPARDDQGKAIAGSYSSTVRWQIPGKYKPVPAMGRLIYDVIVEKNGTVSKCEVIREEGQAADNPVCNTAMRHQPVLDEDGNPQRTRVRLDFNITHEKLPD